MKSEFDDVLAIIPARSGSKRLPGKNKALFADKPMYLNTVDIAKGAGIKNIIISTDDEEILSAKVGGALMLERSKENATDEATTVDVVYETIHFAEAAGFEFKTICLLQVTSPLLQITTLQQALHTFQNKKMACLVAVNKLYQPCGAFYIFNKIDFLFNHAIYMPGLGVYVMNEKESIDVDEIWHFRIAEALHGNRVVVK